MQGKTTEQRRRERRPSAIDMTSERAWRRDHAEASSEGAWMSALAAAAASLAVPAWLVGTCAAFARSLDSSTGPISRPVEAAMVLLGATALVCCARSALSIGFAPRLRDSAVRRRLKVGAVLATVGVIVFIYRAFVVGAPLTFDLFAKLAAVLPVLFLADLSRSLAASAKGRYGTGIGVVGAYMWVAAAALLALVLLGWASWWLPALAASAAALCSASAGSRLWHRYEGRIVTN